MRPTSRLLSSSTNLVSKIQHLEARIAQLEQLLSSKSAMKSAMKYRQLGSTNLRVSALSLGCAPLGGVYGGMSQDVANNIVLNCLRKGINFFDTSPYYGNLQSELVLGRALRNATDSGEFQRSDFIVATKVGRYTSGTDFSAEAVECSVGESMERLQIDSIDLIQCHDIEFAKSLDQVVHECLPALSNLKKKKVVGHVGITGLPLKVLDYVIEQVDGPAVTAGGSRSSSSGDGRVIDTILTYCCYTLNNTGLTEYLPRWKHRRLGIIQGGVTSMGLLTPGGPPDWHPAPEQVRAACRDAASLAEELGENIVKISFQHTFAEQDIHTCLIGVVEEKALDENVQWSNEPMNLELIEEIQSILAPIRNRIWVESGSEENIALASGGFWSKGRGGMENVIIGKSKNLG
jgi:L-galactose dehydrogenase